MLISLLTKQQNGDNIASRDEQQNGVKEEATIIDLKKLRVATHQTQDAIARKVEVSQQYYNMIETGHRRPSVAVAKRIAAVLDFDWTLFYAEE